MTSLRAMERWVGKTAVVTDAGSGAGAGVAAALAAAGMRVVALDRQEEEAITEAVNRLNVTTDITSNVTARQCDVADKDQLGATFHWLDENHGGVHVLISLAGVTGPGQVYYDYVFDAPDENSNPALLCPRHAIWCMQKNDIDGHIINVSSTASKSTEVLNKDLSHIKNKIKVTSIFPGTVNSKPPGSLPEDSDTESGSGLVEPADIAHAVMFALSAPANMNVQELNIACATERGN